MPLIKFASQRIRDLIKTHKITIIRHQNGWHFGTIVLKEKRTAICQIEECKWCGDWVPTLGSNRIVGQAYTHEVEVAQDANGNAVRQVRRGSERMVCYDCYRKKYERIQRSEPVVPRREIPYAKPEELDTVVITQADCNITPEQTQETAHSEPIATELPF